MCRRKMIGAGETESHIGLDSPSPRGWFLPAEDRLPIVHANLVPPTEILLDHEDLQRLLATALVLPGSR